MLIEKKKFKKCFPGQESVIQLLNVARPVA